jgi:tetratricopeptide (TPR) repeat protein
MTRRRKSGKDPFEEREDALRPHPWLGYSRDRLGLYLMERGAHGIAEAQFRRAAWLNPFEPEFRVHQATALMEMGRLGEATALVDEVLKDHPDSATAGSLRKALQARGAGPSGPASREPPVAGAGASP